jgi:hypothetical protein
VPRGEAWLTGADEALMATEESRPEQALTDLHIAGTLDDMQTAQLLGHA